MPKVGRNQPCPCGSGKKYKRCHGAPERLDEDARAARAIVKRRVQAAVVQRERQQGLGRPIIAAEFQGYRLVAVKNRLLHSKGWKTFHDFLGDYIKMAIGSDWGTAEINKPLEERHPILIWYHKVCEHQRTYIKERGKVASAPMTGAVAAYMHLAYALYALDHNADLQEKLLSRLRNRERFPGARYETFVAALFIRAGFEIEFENEDDRSTTHCEFTATHKRTGKRFSVEAKRREGGRLRIGRLFNDALSKHAKYERVIFIDLNVKDDARMEGFLDKTLRRFRSLEGRPLNEQPRPPAYVFVTNMPWDLHLDEPAPRCVVQIEGFQIPDFKGDALAPLRDVVEAREKHIEMHELMRSMQDHTDIPSTFDGDIPEIAFGENQEPRLLIGKRYLVTDTDGVERPGVLTSACVMEPERKAMCALTLDNGTAGLYNWPLSDAEMAAWRKHPDTFFGEVGQRSTKADGPLELYDFFFNSYRETSRDRLLEFLASASDFAALQALDQRALASVYAERCVYGVLANQKKTQ
jgi:hypothetical protein